MQGEEEVAREECATLLRALMGDAALNHATRRAITTQFANCESMLSNSVLRNYSYAIEMPLPSARCCRGISLEIALILH
eukprot:SAG11_NODE_855_length_6868_cov_3.086128_5_plen_79_part_00